MTKENTMGELDHGDDCIGKKAYAIDRKEKEDKHDRPFSDITDEEKREIEAWFPNIIIAKFVSLYFSERKVMLHYTVGGGDYHLNVGDSPEHLISLWKMGFNVINRLEEEK